MQLIPIQRDGTLADRSVVVPDVAREVMATFTGLYATAFVPPWLGYIAIEGGKAVGTCAFKTPPVNGALEIAYFTFPAHEARGVATRMAGELVAIARTADPSLTVIAQTLPAEGASTRVLRRLGFTHTRDVQHPEDGLVWEWHLPPIAR